MSEACLVKGKCVAQERESKQCMVRGRVRCRVRGRVKGVKRVEGEEKGGEHGESPRP